MAIAMAAPLGARRFPSARATRVNASARATPNANCWCATTATATWRARDELVERFIPLARRPRPAATATPTSRSTTCPGRLARPDQGDRPLRARPRARSSRAMPRPRSSASSSGTSATRAGRCTCRATSRSGRSPSAAGDRGPVQGARALAHRPRARRTSLGCTVEQVLEASEAAASYEADVARRAPATRTRPPRWSTCSADERHVLRAGREPGRHRQHLAGASARLERKVVELRFMHDLTQREIGERIGYSQMHVSRLLRAGSQPAGGRCRSRLSVRALSTANPSQSLFR